MKCQETKTHDILKLNRDFFDTLIVATKKHINLQYLSYYYNGQK